MPESGRERENKLMPDPFSACSFQGGVFLSWTIKKKKELLSSVPFNVEELHFYGSKAGMHPWTRIQCPDWVNVLPVTSDGKALLIRQWRVGSMDWCLETPGGAVDSEEQSDPAVAAARELEEETGYTAGELIHMGDLNPNPAINTNRSHFFLAKDCTKPVSRKNFPDPAEDIELVPTPCENLAEMVREGKIDHALAALCIFYAGKFVRLESGKPSGQP